MEDENTREETPQPSPEPAKKKGKLRLWWEKYRPSRRRIIQVYVALLTNAHVKGLGTGRLFRGGSKTVCTPGLNCYSCPAAVGACPLGALQNAFAQSGTRTPVFMLGILLLLGLLFARTVCGWLCPVGLLQELLYKIKTPKLKKSRFTRIFSYFKYVLLAVFVVALPLIFGAWKGTAVPAFCKYICPAGTLGGAVLLLANPANADLYEMLGGLFTWKFALMVAIFTASIFIFRFFCRFFCPLGALYGFFNRIALLGVKLDKSKCTDCGLCVAHCKMDIKRVGDHECINCGECIGICPAKAISWKGAKIFVHENAIPMPEEEKPLAAVLSSGTASFPMTEKTAGDAMEVTMTSPETPKKGRGKVFWLRLCAWVLALAALVGVFVYANVFDGSGAPETVAQVGEVCPDFTLKDYDGNDVSLSQYKGKIVLVNFWATWCGPCVSELPLFEQIKEKYGDEVEVLALHSADVSEDVPKYLQTQGWTSWNVTFLQDERADYGSRVFGLLGGKDSYPVTVVVDAEGVVQTIQQGSVDYDYLDTTIQLLQLLAG